VKAAPPSEKNARNLKKAGWVCAGLSALSLLAGIVWGTSWLGLGLMHLGFHSIFMMTFLLAFVALILFTNATSTRQDAKAYDFQPELFATDRIFLIGSSGIVVIIVALYAYFW